MDGTVEGKIDTTFKGRTFYQKKYLGLSVWEFLRENNLMDFDIYRGVLIVETYRREYFIDFLIRMENDGINRSETENEVVKQLGLKDSYEEEGEN